MTQTFINLRFEQIKKRFDEIDILLLLADQHQNTGDFYQALCRSAHVLLVSHFEGLYKDVCKDVIDDINKHTSFFQVKKEIFHTYCNYFLQDSTQDTKQTNEIRKRLFALVNNSKSKLTVAPFLFVDNKNPTPQIIENILEKFGIKKFFAKIAGSDIDIVFEDLKSKTEKFRSTFLQYLKKNTASYPYSSDISFIRLLENQNINVGKTLWEDFLNNFLKDRHDIIHGHTLNNPLNHKEIEEAKTKIEILLYTFILHLCSAANPVFILGE